MSAINSTGLAIALAIPFLLAGFALYPFLHNQYVHPMGRLARSVVVGESCAEIRSRFDRYAATSDSRVVHQSETTTSMNLYRTEEVPLSRLLELHDESAFDALNLLVRCNPESQAVAEKLFTGD